MASNLVIQWVNDFVVAVILVSIRVLVASSLTAPLLMCRYEPSFDHHVLSNGTTVNRLAARHGPTIASPLSVERSNLGKHNNTIKKLTMFARVGSCRWLLVLSSSMTTSPSLNPKRPIIHRISVSRLNGNRGTYE